MGLRKKSFSPTVERATEKERTSSSSDNHRSHHPRHHHNHHLNHQSHQPSSPPAVIIPSPGQHIPHPLHHPPPSKEELLASFDKDSSSFRHPFGSSTAFKVLKYFVFCYMVLILITEIGWSVYSTQGLKRDLQAYVDAGDWEQTYVREFYKSTKNFFMFNLILIFLSICIGCAAVGTENKKLILAFLVIFSIEWGFEIIGVYNSGDRNVVIYRMIPALLRPGLIVGTVIYYRALGKILSQSPQNCEETNGAGMVHIPSHRRHNQHQQLNGNVGNHRLPNRNIHTNNGNLVNGNNHHINHDAHTVRVTVRGS